MYPVIEYTYIDWELSSREFAMNKLQEYGEQGWEVVVIVGEYLILARSKMPRDPDECP